MALRTAGSVLVVFLWSVAGVLGQNTVKSVCALKGSSVDMRCPVPSVTQVTEIVWFNTWLNPYDLRWDPKYDGRVEYSGTTEKDCILRITDLRQSDITTYHFRYKTNQYSEWKYSYGFTLSLTDLKVERIYHNKLTCSTTCTLTDNPTYIWYKNGQHLDESTSPQYKYSVSSNYDNSYSCAVKGHEDLHSPAVCVQGQSCNTVTYTKRTICALKGSTVYISCTYDSGYDTVKSSLWFSPKQRSRWSDKLTPEDLTRDPGYAGRVEYPDKERWRYTGHSTLRISNLREEDSAEYRFTFKTYYFEWGHSFPGTTLSVTGLQVKVTPAAEGQKTLTCITTCTLTDNPTYIWYKNGQNVQGVSSPMYSISSENADSYFCAVKGHEDLSSPTVYKPKNTSVSVSPSGEIVDGSSVTLTCSSDANPPVQSYTWWYKKNGGDNQSMTGPQHVFNQIQSSDTGEYYCESQNEMGTDMSRTINMDVKYGPKNTSVSVSPSGEIVEGSSVTLTCSSDANPPVDKYTWYQKNGASLRGSEKTYNFTTIISEDRGEYYCEAENKYRRLNSSSVFVDVQYGPKNTSVSLSPSGEIVEGSSVTLTCSSDANPPVDIYTWYKKNGGGYQSMTGPQHVFKQIQSSDSGEYYCEAQNEMGTDMSRTINMDVKYTPKNTSVSVSPSREIVEGSSVTLTCSSDANPPVDKYTWYQKNVTSPKASGQSYSITNIISEDRGEYYCEAENKYGRLNSSSVSVDVQYGPKNTSVSVSPSGEIVEGSSVTLTCSSDANPPVDKYTWYKKNATSPKASGQSYSITNISSEDRGEYYCEAQNGRGSMNSTALMIIIAGKQTSVVTAAVGIIVVVLVLILCFSGFMWFRRSTGGSDATADTQSVRPDCNSDTYTGLNMRTMSPDYDTLISVHPDPNSDTYTPLNMKTRSPEYDTLANVRGISH
ncbi:B-cell receptor CD22 isoform X6 [Oncorhynchus kisutch]|uniref:B-cell receptor CD22 isoform X6 n=1 Tax=Oncorhynchus kisutch TaxID=8019 RepID=UPI0012DD67A0|nr:B-cell receptor CD22 isoform X6 [Oncorhynchus kisutch]